MILMEKQNLISLWKECLESIRVSVSPAVFSTWFSKTILKEINKNGDIYVAIIGVPNIYAKTTIETRYYALIQDSLSKSLSGKCNLIFNIYEEENKQTSQDDTPLFTESGKTTLLENIPVSHFVIPPHTRLRADYTFDKFAVSSSNQMAWAGAEAVAKSPGTAYNPLFIWGGVGLGKTHLMSAVGLEILKRDGNKKVFFCTGEDFTNDIVEGIRKKTTQSFRDKYRKLNCLLIDDIQFIAGKDTVQEEFFHTFNAIVSSGGQVILTSDRPPQEISKLEERMRSRFEAGLVVDIAPPDFELRCAIVQIKSKDKNLDLPTNIVHLIAANVDSPRKIIGFLTKLASEYHLKKLTEIGEDLIQSLLGKKTDESTNGFHLPPEKVIDAACKHFDIGKRMILGDSRLARIALPRQVLMYILRVELKLQLTEVGRVIGGRDHTTVMHAVEKVTKLASSSVDIREDIESIKKIMRG